VLELARLARRTYGLSEVALPVLTELATTVGETALLTRRVGDLVVCLTLMISTPQRHHPILPRTTPQPADRHAKDTSHLGSMRRSA
jgi:DNA-binding IclR family transcriptional regulator